MYKKIVSFLIIITLVFSNSITVFAASDVTPPKLDISSLKVDKKEATKGDTVKISFKATDDMSGIDSVYIYYIKPITRTEELVIMSYNETTKLYEGDKSIDESTQAGEFKIKSIYLGDKQGNYTWIYNINENSYGYIKEELSAGNFIVKGTSSDVTPPKLDISSLKVDKKEATKGDTVKISFKATDDMSGIDSVYIYCINPITRTEELVIMSYNETTKLYEGDKSIDESTQVGEFKMKKIYLCDKQGNDTWIYNINENPDGDIKEDLSAGNFIVKGTSSDVTPPKLDISSLKVDKKEATKGHTVKISFKATDDMSGIDSVYIYYIKPITRTEELVIMSYNETTKLYEGYKSIDENTQSGEFKIKSIYLCDKQGNSTWIYNINENPDADIKEDLSAGNFIVINKESSVKPIDGITVVTKNENWTNKYINGDLYIGPQAVLTVNGNVTVSGSVYVLGSLKSYGGLNIKGTLNGTNMSWGGNPTLYNGTIVISGSNSIVSSIMTDSPVKEIPIRIDNETLVAKNGKLNIKGATINVVDMYIEGQKVVLDYNGCFDLKDIFIGSKEKIKVEFKTIFGNTIVREFNISDYVKEDINKDGEIDILDLSQIALKYNETSYLGSENTRYDMNDDEIIDIYDLVICAIRTSRR
ncbi:Ig-like domain repeat protein [Clostridium gasigenes]|uniref:Ig-like domain repeat protein n=1 Tax=Clostridium gasigenes TaxID=94869 RepID=UPI001C0BCA35|nr:Ig-like domain repeat protein [Clostridium gasigenes]MBU3103139.1 Ig-like domain repeat protein [Clostridium gasigenes]